MPTHTTCVCTCDRRSLKCGSAFDDHIVSIIEGLFLFAPRPRFFLSSRRGVGCIMFEMATGRPMFPGATVKEELHLIFRLVGKKAQAE